MVFWRWRRLLPDTAAGRAHIDTATGAAMTELQLETELKKIQETLEFIHPGEALAELASGTRLPESSAVLTFDESFATTAELAMPVLHRLQIPALFFVSTESIANAGKIGSLWDQDIHALVEDLAPEPIKVPWVDRVLKTETPAQRANAIRRLLLSLVSLDEERIEERIRALYDRLGRQPRTKVLDRMLTGAELEALCQDPLVSVGAHGHLHHAFTSLSDVALQAELRRPRELLREICGPSFVDAVSYPFGRPPYVDERVVTAAQEAGYRAGFTALKGVARPSDHLFWLPRLALGTDGQDAYELQGISDAIDELILVASGTESRRFSDIEG